MKRVFLWSGIIIALGLMVWGLAKFGATSGTTTTGGPLADAVRADDWTQGNRLAKTVLVEYGDFQCPGCGAYYPVVKQLTDKYASQMLFVYRDFPLTSIHRNAQISAQAAEAAGVQGKFWEMHDLLFAKQSEWAESDKAQEIFSGYAQTIGLDVQKFKTDLNSSVVMDRVKWSADSAGRSSVDATPTFFLNGQKLTNLQTFGDLQSAVENSINGK